MITDDSWPRRKYCFLHYLRLPLQSRWDLCSSRILCSIQWWVLTEILEQPVSSIFKYQEIQDPWPLKMGPMGCLETLVRIVDEWKTNLMSLAVLFHLLCAQHVSDINMSTFRSLWLCWWITTSVVLFSVRCVLEFLLRLVFGENKTTDVVIHQHSRKLLKIDILMSETCWAHNKWNKIASVIKLVFHSSTNA